MIFKVGDRVRWMSQAGGHTKAKEGIVAQVVPPQCYPERARFLHLFKNAGVGKTRDHESYVVMVKTRPYWPRANQLTPAESSKGLAQNILEYLHTPANVAAVTTLGAGNIVSRIQKMCEADVARARTEEGYRRVAFEVIEPLLSKLLTLESAFQMLKSPPWPSMDEVRDAYQKLKAAMSSDGKKS